MTDSIQDLYPYALAEGEGVGTAYEYVAKARIVEPLLAPLGRGVRILVAGLPEKYGTSLDFAILAHRAGAAMRVVDDRPAAIERARRAIDEVQATGRLAGLRVEYECGSVEAAATSGRHDIVLSCEVLQRIPGAGRHTFANALRTGAPAGAVFVPNSENGSHLKISGLPGLTRNEMAALFTSASFDYVDMPPFPPGITRSAEQRTRASTGLAEKLAMRGLDAYCAAERLVPAVLKRHVAHIVCAAWGA